MEHKSSQDRKPILGLILTTEQALDYPKRIVSEVSWQLHWQKTPHLMVEIVDFGKFADLISATRSTDQTTVMQAWKELIYMTGSAACRLEDAGVRALAVCPKLPRYVTDQFRIQKAEVLSSDDISYLAQWYCQQIQGSPD